MEEKDFVPYEKMSKKERRRLDEAKRSVWPLSPFTRVVPNKKAYDRNKVKEEDRRSDDEG